MKKKIVALCLIVCLAATAIAGASLAYFTDTDAKTNTFTSGNVKIQLVEEQRTSDADDTRVDFAPDKNVLPYTGDEGTQILAKNYVDKIVNVKRLGTEPAYVRVLVAVPAALKEALHIDWNTQQWDRIDAEELVVINGTLHNVYVMTYKAALMQKKDVTADQAMYGFYLDPAVDYVNNVGYTLHGQPLGIDLSNLQIPVVAQGVQATGFDSADEAFNAAYDAENLTVLPEGWELYTEPQM